MGPCACLGAADAGGMLFQLMGLSGHDPKSHKPMRFGCHADAQHVLLVEPLLDPAVQAQAVGRVHRIGQSRPTQVLP